MNETKMIMHMIQMPDNVAVRLRIIAQLALPKTVISMLDNSDHKREGSISASS